MTTALQTTAQSRIALVNRYLDRRDDRYDFHSLNGHRAEVEAKVGAMLEIEALVNQGESVGRASQTAAKNSGQRRGFSATKLQRDYKLWRKGGRKPAASGQKTGPVYPARDWRLFVPRYTNGNAKAAAATPEFIQHLCSLDTGSRDDTGAAVWSMLLRAWAEGDEIPGYGTVYQWHAKQGRPVPSNTTLMRARPGVDVPEGWSPSNIGRILREARGPKKSAKYRLMKQGEKAAHDHWGDQLLRRRENLMPFELITADDFDVPLYVILGDQLVKPKGMIIMDVATGFVLKHGILGSFHRSSDRTSQFYEHGKDAGVRKGLSQDDLRFLLLAMYEQYGYPVDWQSHYLFEEATATLPAHEQRLLCDNFNIARIDGTGVVKKLHASGFGEGGGMPWRKGWAESWFRPLKTRLDLLPGATGRDRLSANQRTGVALWKNGKQRANRRNTLVGETLAKIDEAKAAGIPIEQLKLRPLTFAEFEALLAEWVHRLNTRTKHNLQGFDDVYEWEFQGELIGRNDPLFTELLHNGHQFGPAIKRKESPAERFYRLCQGHRFSKPHPQQLMTLAMDKRPITVNAKGQINLSVPRVSSQALIFWDADSADAVAPYHRIKDALLGFVAHDASCVHLFTNDDALDYVASPTRLGAIDMAESLYDRSIEFQAANRADANRDRTRDAASELLAPHRAALDAARAHDRALLDGRDGCPQPSASPVVAAVTQAEATQRRKAASKPAQKARETAQNERWAEAANRANEDAYDDDLNDF